MDFHFDIMCPYAYQTSLWMRDVRDQLDLDVRWRFFSLEEINRSDGKKHPWERQWSYGWSMMRVAAMLRRIDPDLLDQWYEAAGTALHVEGLKPHRREVAEHLVAQMGLDPSLVGQAIEDPTTNDEVKAEHDRVVALGGWGVPTLVFDNAHALFGPVLIDPPTGPAAVRLWELVTGWSSSPISTRFSIPKGRRICANRDRISALPRGEGLGQYPEGHSMTDLSTIRAALEESFDAFETLGGDLSTSEWETPSLCPEWTVRGVFEHLVGIENALVSWVPDGTDSPPSFSLAGTFAKEVAELDAPAFMERVRGVFARRRRDLSALGPSDLAQPSWTPVGPGTYGRFMDIRVFDFWVHERDITHPTWSPDGRHGSAGEHRTVGSRGVARLHRRQEDGPARRPKHRVPSQRPPRAGYRCRRRRKGQGGRNDRPG